MRDRKKYTERIVFQEETEASAMTHKLPIGIESVDLITGQASLSCYCFKTKADKDNYIAAEAQYKVDFDALNDDIAQFNADYQAAIPELKKGLNASIRQPLKDRKDALDARVKALKKPELDRSVAMKGDFPVVISDTSVFDSLIDQIPI